VVTNPIPILGGKSVFCINEEQMKEAARIRKEDRATAQKIESILGKIEKDLTRNEQAALAFTLIERLKKSNVAS